MEVRFLGHACFELSDGDTTVLIDPFLTGNPKAAIAAEDVGGDDDPAHPRPRRPHRRHRRDRQADRRAGGGDHRAGRRARRGGRRRARSQPRRDDQVRLGLGQDRARMAHLDHAEGHGQHPRRPADQLPGHDRLPPRRHVRVLATCARRQARADRRRADVHRRPLHDGSRRCGRRRRARRRQDRDPVPLQHVPADRDRRPGVQVRRRVGDAVERRRARARASRTRRDPRDRPDPGGARGRSRRSAASWPTSRAWPRRTRSPASGTSSRCCACASRRSSRRW